LIIVRMIHRVSCVREPHAHTKSLEKWKDRKEVNWHAGAKAPWIVLGVLFYWFLVGRVA
jgi:hypothetical protein